MGGAAVDGKIIVVCGVKKSGKTTLLTKLIKECTGRGMKVAVIKHDGHDFACDLPGTDSHRLKEAGAYGTAVFSGSRLFLHKTGTKEKEEHLIRMFPEADLIFIEGLKDSAYPKIEVIRDGISEFPVSNREGRFLIVTDREKTQYGEMTVSFDQIKEITDQIIKVSGGMKP